MPEHVEPPTDFASETATTPDRRRMWSMLISLALVALTLIVFAPVRNHEFLHNFDDDMYALDNPQVLGGLTWENVTWAVSSGHAANWHPLTWWSLMLDAEIHGDNAGGFLMTNVLMHAAAAIALFVAFWQLTGAMWKSAFVAAMFAVHPQHVESVAWVSERKDVLSTVFGMLAIWAYGRYVSSFKRAWYVLLLVCFFLSLLAKQMMVTLPFVLLLLDVWPLQRADGFVLKRKNLRLVLEKLPLFALSVLMSVVIYVVQNQGGSVGSRADFPFVTRFFNATVVYWMYFYKTFWPADLACYYPHPGRAISNTAVILSAIALLAISVAAITQIKRRPYILIGWLWYLGMLVPVVGFVQIGGQQMADRYTYVPIIGLFVAVTWLVSDLIPAGSARRTLLSIAALMSITICAVIARIQVGYWQNSITLFEHAIAVTAPNWFAQNNLAKTHLDEHRLEAAKFHYQEAIKINPRLAAVQYNLGYIFQVQGNNGQAIQHYRRALDANGRMVAALNNLGHILYKQRNYQAAEFELRKALEIEPANVDVLFNLGNCLIEQNRAGDAIPLFRKATQIDRENVVIEYHLALALVEHGDDTAAQKQFSHLLESRPDFAEAHNELGKLLLKQGKRDAAIKHFREAVKLAPDLPEAKRNLRTALEN